MEEQTNDLQIAELCADHGLSIRQARFAIFFAATGNASGAARDAGYSEKASKEEGYRLLRNTRVRSAVASLKGKLLEAAGTSVLRVLQELAAVAHAKMGDYLEELPPPSRKPRKTQPGDEQLALFDEDEIPKPSLKLKPLKKIDTRAISEIDMEKGRIKLYSKLEAAEKLLKVAGAYAPDRFEHSGPGGSPIEVASALDDDRRAAAIASLLALTGDGGNEPGGDTATDPEDDAGAA